VYKLIYLLNYLFVYGSKSCIIASKPQICINILSRYRTSYSRRILSCSQG